MLLCALASTAFSVVAEEGERMAAPTMENTVVKRAMKGDIPVNVKKPELAVASARDGEEEDLKDIAPLIQNPPGHSAYFYRNATGIYPYATEEGIGFYRYTSRNDAQKCYVDGNDVYIYDILQSASPYDEAMQAGYVKGVLDGDKLTISLPQTVMTYDSYYFETTIYYTLCILEEIEDDGGLWYVPDESFTSVTYSYEPETGVYTLQLPEVEGKTYGLGLRQLTKEDFLDGWGEYVDFTQSFTPLKEEVIEMPANAEPDTYQMIQGLYGYEVKIYQEGQDIYVQGFASSYPEMTFRATEYIDGSAVIPQFQYVGIDEYNNRYMQLRLAYPIPEEPDYIIQTPDSLNYYLVVDHKNEKMYSSFPNLWLLLCNAPSNGINTLQSGVKDFIFQKQESMAGVPATPLDLEFSYNEEIFEYTEYYSFYFTIPSLSTEGNVIDMEDLYYRVYANGELMTFDYNDPIPGAYWGAENMDLVPFLFSNGNDIYALYSDFNRREIGVYMDPSTMGVQSVYIYEGEETCSPIVTLNIATGEISESFDGGSVPGTAGIGSVNDITVVNVEYLDLSGRRISHPEKGIYLKRSVMSDGSVKVTKVAL